MSASVQPPSGFTLRPPTRPAKAEALAKAAFPQNFAYSPQISPFPANHSFTNSVVTDFGLSIGNPNARSQQRLARTPNARLTPNNTV
jgi:hypothetical protein